MKSFITKFMISGIEYAGPTIHAESWEDAKKQAAEMDVCVTLVVEGELE